MVADAGGLSEIAQHGAAAAVFPPGDVAGLADAVAETLNEPDRAKTRAEAATRSLSERFAWDGIAMATVGVYESVTQGGRATG